MSLLGSMIAGGVAGGAAAQQKSLFERAEEQRKLSFAKIQQEYAQKNAELVSKLAGGREEAGREFQREQSTIERAQKLSDLEKAQAREDAKTASDREYEETLRQRKRGEAKEDFSWQLGVATEAEKQKIAAQLQAKMDNFAKFKTESDAAKYLPAKDLANIEAAVVYGIPMPEDKKAKDIPVDLLKEGMRIAEMSAPEDATPEELAVSGRYIASILHNTSANTKTVKGGFEPKDTETLVNLTKRAMQGNTGAQKQLDVAAERIKAAHGEKYYNDLMSKINQLAEATTQPFVPKKRQGSVPTPTFEPQPGSPLYDAYQTTRR